MMSSGTHKWTKNTKKRKFYEKVRAFNGPMALAKASHKKGRMCHVINSQQQQQQQQQSFIYLIFDRLQKYWFVS